MHTCFNEKLDSILFEPIKLIYMKIFIVYIILFEYFRSKQFKVGHLSEIWSGHVEVILSLILNVSLAGPLSWTLFLWFFVFSSFFFDLFFYFCPIIVKITLVGLKIISGLQKNFFFYEDKFHFKMIKVKC